ncbi:hypothetical protein CIB48_g7728 [Xylaria polymorpha]|nr:hypothetical protein CIB48_g7728 [Xylaria polymorpha]
MVGAEYLPRHSFRRLWRLMEGERKRKRRRLVRADIARATVEDTSSSSAVPKTEGDHNHNAINRYLNEKDTPVDKTKSVANIVCYGMLENLPITSTATVTIIDNPILVSASFNENGLVQRTSDGTHVGKLEDRATQCLLKLGDEEDVEIQFMFKSIAGQTYSNRQPRRVESASAIIYGPEELSDDAGEFLDRCNYVLQDPFGCERNVPYKNPHCLSTLFETPRMTFELHNPNPKQNTFTLSGSLKALETTDDLPEWPQPAALKTELHRRERMETTKHIWRVKTLADGSSTYINGINGSYQNIPPPIWNGGILADEMGLGKTLQMISLIAADKEFRRQPHEARPVSSAGPRMATLVVVPLSLISVWEYQLGHHLRPSTLTWGRHHRKTRFTSRVAFACPDVVLTTYQTVQAEHKRHDSNSGSLFGHQWRRIILDEAHNIRNKTVTASAIFALKAVSRWAVTGTPIQNSLADICGLLSFLQFRPYDSTKLFDEDIIECFRRGNVEVGTQRLQTLCQPIMIRRPKSVIVLPTREDLIKEVEFSAGMCSTAMALLVDQQTDLTTPEVEDSAETTTASEVALGSTGCEECHEIIDILDTDITTDAAPYAQGELLLQQTSLCASPAFLEPGQATHTSLSVVFSFWTSSLAMAQKALTAAGIRCVRIDGSLSLMNREKVLQEFNEDEEIKVILVTISCGGVGLDLTAASRAHLLEPQWNPAVEDQALARVHRMGQRRPVITMRYLMKDSIEESIASVKGKKQLLSELLPRTSLSLHSDEE